MAQYSLLDGRKHYGTSFTRQRHDYARVSFGVSLKGDVKFHASLGQLTTILQQADITLPRFPLQEPDRRAMEVKISPTGSAADQELRELRINGEQVLYRDQSGEAQLNLLRLADVGPGQTMLSGAELRSLVELNYFYPTNKLTKKWDDKILVLDPDHCLLRVDTSSETGFEVRAD